MAHFDDDRTTAWQEKSVDRGEGKLDFQGKISGIKTAELKLIELSAPISQRA